MWILQSVQTGELFYLTAAKQYVVGKLNADLKLDDTSISRSHAALHLTRSDAADSSQLAVEDVGSKYGTFLADGKVPKRLEKGERVALASGARIRFGVLKNLWQVSHQPLVTVTSGLLAAETKQLQRHLLAVGGRVTSRWAENCTHLTMTECVVTVKLLHALLAQLPIVTCRYWRDFQAAVSKQAPLPLARDYWPQYCPGQKTQDVDLGCRPERKTLFAHTTFVFTSRRQYELYASIIALTGGTCQQLKDGVAKATLLKPTMVVIQHIPATESQSASQTINSMEEYLETAGRRVIPDYEIGLAIVHCSKEKYCNPSYKIVGDLLPDSAMDVEDAGSNSADAVLVPNTRTTVVLSDSDGDESITETQVNTNMQLRRQTLVASVASPVASVSPPVAIVQPPVASVQPPAAEVSLNFDSDEDELLLSVLKERQTPSPLKRRLPVDDADEDIFTSGNDSPAKKKGTARQGNVSKRAKLGASPAKPPPPPRSAQAALSATQRSRINISGFLNKSDIPRTQEPTMAAVMEQMQTTIKKRAHINVLSDGEENDDDDASSLFNFNDDDDDGGADRSVRPSPAKKRCHNNNRQPAKDDDNDDDLFRFSDQPPAAHGSLQAAASSSAIGRATTASSIAGERRAPLPQPKALPSRISTEKWLLSSLNLLKMEDDNGESVKKEELDADESTQQQAWLNSFKAGLPVRTINVTRQISSSKSSPTACLSSVAASSSTAGPNFKTFIKRYKHRQLECDAR